MVNEVLKGLHQQPKTISSKFLYDEQGSRIFEKITEMPSYYLYNAEYEILKEQGNKIWDALPFSTKFSLVEFGAGDGSKTIELLKQIPPHSYFDQYIPVDISNGANRTLAAKIGTTIPDLPVWPIQGNYLNNMERLIPRDQSILLLYLGSNIGNFKSDKIRQIIMDFGRSLKPGDALLIGFDLRKNPLTIRHAYDDPEGITRSFNMNLLTRFNRELGADFDLEQFDFYSYYHPGSGEVRSYLVSLVDQEIHFNISNDVISLAKNELIHTEISKKFYFEEMADMLCQSGFGVRNHWVDSRDYFTNVLAVRE